MNVYADKTVFVFSSDWLTQHVYVNLQYLCLADANQIACDKSTQPAVLGEATGTLGSLQQPYGYEKFSSCQWLIVAQPGEVSCSCFTSNNSECASQSVTIHHIVF
jgi:hypothetical protein